MPTAHLRFAFVRISLALLAAGCGTPSSQAQSLWPPEDFVLEVEWTSGGAPEQSKAKRFTVDATGLCVFAKSSSPIVDPKTKAALPVFDSMCAYRLRPECTRLLARKLHLRGVRGLEPQQGAVEDLAAPAIRIRHGAFGPSRSCVAVGEAHGAFVKALHVINSFLPPSESFWLPGMTGDGEPEHLADVPAPLEGAPAALAWQEDQLRERGDQPQLLLDAFAVSCRLGDRARSEQLLARWEAAAVVSASKEAPFADAPRVLPEMLRRMLP